MTMHKSWTRLPTSLEPEEVQKHTHPHTTDDGIWHKSWTHLATFIQTGPEGRRIWHKSRTHLVTSSKPVRKKYQNTRTYFKRRRWRRNLPQIADALMFFTGPNTHQKLLTLILFSLPDQSSGRFDAGSSVFHKHTRFHFD